MVNDKFTVEDVKKVFSSFTKERNFRHLTLGKLISYGGFSLIYDVIDKKNKMNYVAKVIPVDYITFEAYGDSDKQSIINSVYNEVIALKRCMKENCRTAELIDVYEYECDDASPIYILMFKKYQSFESYFNPGLNVMTEYNVWRLAMSTLETLNCLTSLYDYSEIFSELSGKLNFEKYYTELNRIPDSKMFYMLHRDIKPSNFLIETENNEVSFLLSDFGSSVVCVPGDYNQFSKEGTIGYMPFECGAPLWDKKNYDLYSLAKVLLYMSTPDSLTEETDDIVFPPGLSRDFAAVISIMLNSDVDERYATPSVVLSELSRIRSSDSPYDYDLISKIKFHLKSKDFVGIFNHIKKEYEENKSDYLCRIYAFMLVSGANIKVLQGHAEPSELDSALKTALQLISPLVEKGDMKACFLYSLFGMQLPGIDNSYCNELLFKSAESGFAPAEYLYGRLGLSHKNLVSIPDRTAVDYIASAAEKYYQPAVEYYLKKLNKPTSRLSSLFSSNDTRLKCIEYLSNGYLLKDENVDPLYKEIRKIEYLF